MRRSRSDWFDLSQNFNLAEVKRVHELCRGDREFLAQATFDAKATFRQRGLSIDPEMVRPLWQSGGVAAPCEHWSAELEHYADFLHEGLDCSHSLESIDAAPNRAYAAWRSRQMARCREELGQSQNSQLMHAPAAFELTRGCSVGCWFCGLGAQKLTGAFGGSETERQIWREAVTGLLPIFGQGLQAAFCYWATDPLDNPHYEDLGADFANIAGVFPHTTTALALRDVDRTRRLLQQSESLGCQVNRFSVLSVKALRRIHELFSPAELLFVDLVLQIPGHVVLKARAGHAREAANRAGVRSRETFGDSATIACVSGFLLNMVERSVKLVTPCRPDDSRPLGYITLAAAEFRDSGELDKIVHAMMDQHMPLSPPRTFPLRFQPHLRYRELADGICLESDLHPLHRRVFRGAAWWLQLGRLVQSGHFRPAEVQTEMQQVGVDHATTAAALQQLFDRGTLNEGAAEATPAELSLL